MRSICLMRIALLIFCIISLMPVLGFTQNDTTSPVVLQPKALMNTSSAKEQIKSAATVETNKKTSESDKKTSAAVVKDPILQKTSHTSIAATKQSNTTKQNRRTDSRKKKSITNTQGGTKIAGVIAAKPAIPVVSIKEMPALSAKNIELPVQHKNRPDKIAALLNDKTVDHSDSTLNGKALFSTLMALLLVLGLAYATILLIKWASGQRGMSQSSRGRMKVLESARLSQTGTIHIVNVKGKNLLIGASSGQVTLLQELEPDDESELAEEEKSNFQGYLEKYSKAGNSEAPSTRIASFLRDSSQQLKEKYRAHNSSKTSGGKKP